MTRYRFSQITTNGVLVPWVRTPGANVALQLLLGLGAVLLGSRIAAALSSA